MGSVDLDRPGRAGLVMSNSWEFAHPWLIRVGNWVGKVCRVEPCTTGATRAEIGQGEQRGGFRAEALHGVRVVGQ